MNPYQILQISSGSNLDQIKLAYKRLARVYHPTKGGSKEQFVQLQQAYQLAVKHLKTGTVSDGAGAPTDHQSLRTGFGQFLQRQQQLPDSRGTQFPSQETQNPFNQQFQEQRGADDMVYQVNTEDYRERTKQDFERENTNIYQQPTKI